MLAEREAPALEIAFLRLLQRAPLLHQLQPQLLRVVHRDRELVQLPDHHVLQLGRQLAQRLSAQVDLLVPPVPPLGRDVGRGDDADVRVDEEQGEDLAVARAGAVGQREGRDAVLQDVGEGEEAVLEARDAAQLLRGRAVAVATEDGGQPAVVVLLVSNIPCYVCVCALAERERAGRDVFVGVVVYRGGADVLVLIDVSFQP